MAISVAVHKSGLTPCDSKKKLQLEKFKNELHGCKFQLHIIGRLAVRQNAYKILKLLKTFKSLKDAKNSRIQVTTVLLSILVFDKKLLSYLKIISFLVEMYIIREIKR